MARWRLKSPHYLNVPGTEYELQETDRATGKSVKKKFQVGLYLNPDDPTDHNYPGNPSIGQEGSIIVTDKFDKQFPRDILFLGPPTPEMEPLDEAAEKLTAEWQKKWTKVPVESLPTTISQSQL